MRIESTKFEEELKNQRLFELSEIELAHTNRPCLRCDIVCETCGSRGCECNCSPDCELAPTMLTSDPEFPVEPSILPLVFALAQLGITEPCWSCEGHLGPDGNISRLPQVWFYTRQQMIPRVIGEFLGNLRSHHQLSAVWSIVSTFAPADSLAPAFAIRPIFEPEEAADLKDLQTDARLIGATLAGEVRSRAGRYLER